MTDRIRYEEMPEGVEITSTGLRYETEKYLVVMEGLIIQVWKQRNFATTRRRSLFLLRQRHDDPIVRAKRFAELCYAALLDALPDEVPDEVKNK